MWSETNVYMSGNLRCPSWIVVHCRALAAAAAGHKKKKKKKKKRKNTKHPAPRHLRPVKYIKPFSSLCHAVLSLGLFYIRYIHTLHTMSQGTLYSIPFTRGQLPTALIKHYNLDVKVAAPDAEFAKYFSTKKIPGFVFPDGEPLHEVIAILYYLIDLIDAKEIKHTLLGTNQREKYQVLKWLSFANSDFAFSVVPAAVTAMPELPMKLPPDLIKNRLTSAVKYTKVFEERLNSHKYLVNDDVVTIADLHAFQIWFWAMTYVYDDNWRKNHPAVTQWYERVRSSPIIQADPLFSVPVLEKSSFADILEEVEGN